MGGATSRAWASIPPETGLAPAFQGRPAPLLRNLSPEVRAGDSRLRLARDPVAAGGASPPPSPAALHQLLSPQSARHPPGAASAEGLGKPRAPDRRAGPATLLQLPRGLGEGSTSRPCRTRSHTVEGGPLGVVFRGASRKALVPSARPGGLVRESPQGKAHQGSVTVEGMRLRKGREREPVRIP